MTDRRLPDGFAVQIDRRVKTLGSGSALLGGSPRRLLRLSPAAQRLLADSPTAGRLEVRDAVTAQLARSLLDATVAHPRPATGPSHRDVTVVIPVRDNAPGLRRLLMTLRAVRVVVVDDGSEVPVDPGEYQDLPCQVTVLRHERSKGPGAARNTGIAHCDNEFVAFLDSDVVPRKGWLEGLLGHFCDPDVALAAPRIVALGECGDLISRYEEVRSALDLGEREGPVVPYGPVSYVPSAAVICRRSAILEVGGFDESMPVGEDVDLCWRLVEAGFRLRYEPIALVAHEHRTQIWEWLSRRAFYGSSAAALSLRHPDKSAALVISRWSLLTWILLATGSRAGLLGSIACAAVYVRRIARSLSAAGDDARPGEATVLALGGLGIGALQLSSATVRSYWPAALVAAVASTRYRRAVLLATVIDATYQWVTRRRRPDDGFAPDRRVAVRPTGPVSYLALKRLDDLAYGAGLWTGMVRGRTLRPLIPDIRP
ncbi:MAG: mycofactocin biosynthesis glycosyltransferase MftF [Mycobacterium sp.]|nr:mycofactocin biosynthesis glycosyltransferase MftF [Mycobacterium sp.]